MRISLLHIIFLLLLMLPVTADSSDIFDAIRSGDQTKLTRVLDKKPEAYRQRDEHGRTPLQEAVKLSNIAMVQLLINKGADVNARDPSGKTPLIYTSLPYHIEQDAYKTIAELLISQGAKTDITDCNAHLPGLHS